MEEMVMPKGLLLAAFDFRTAHEDEFHDWYDTEHVPERLGVAGILNAERWIDEADPKIAIATYDLETAAVVDSAPYKAVGGDNGTPWTKRIARTTNRLMRFVGEQLRPGEVVAPSGAGALLMASMNVDPAVEPEFNEWYNAEHLPQLGAVPGVLTARRYRATDPTSERRFVAIYHLRDVGVSRSDAWARAANTPWSDKMRPHFQDMMVLRLNRYQRKA
jgi:hypothetical protein